MSIRILIADDDALLRAGLSAVLRTDPALELIGEAGDGLEAITLSQALCPHVILMDVRMPGIDGIEATRRIKANGTSSRILVLTTFPDDDYVAEALRAGASGFLLKRVAPERLLEAVHTIAAGNALLDATVTRGVIERSLATPPRRDEAAQELLMHLTQRELEVLRLVGAGWSNSQIATALTIAESTAQTHVKRVLTKLGARDRAHAVAIAHFSGAVRDTRTPQ